VTARAALALLLGVAAVHGGWKDEAGGLRSGPFPPPPAELRARYSFGWSGLEAAAADVDLRRGRDGVWTARVTGGTTGAARALWKLDADYEARVLGTGWRSLGAVLTETYLFFRAVETMQFPPGGVRSRRVTTKSGAGPPEWQDHQAPGLRDMAGALLLARSQPLADGDELSLAVFPGEGMYLVRVRVERRETIRWQGADRAVIRLSLQIDSIKRDHTLQPHRKFRSGTVWVSDDEIRLPLRVEVGVFIGHVFAELVSLRTRD
jgi:hypothetical protein